MSNNPRLNKQINTFQNHETGTHYNINRDYNPVTGRYIQSDPIGFDGGLNEFGYVDANSLISFDLIGLTEGSSSNIFKRKEINRIAKSYDGSTVWCYNCKKDNFNKGTNKCNKFVYDVIRQAGASEARTWPYQAADWARCSYISNWRCLDVGETPEGGDIAAYKLSGGGSAYSGHTGFITSTQVSFWGITQTELMNISAHGDAVYEVWNQFLGNSNTRYRRYIGE